MYADFRWVFFNMSFCLTLTLTLTYFTRFIFNLILVLNYFYCSINGNDKKIHVN